MSKDLRQRGSKGGCSIDMDAHHESTPLLGVCPTPVCHEISVKKLFEQSEPKEADDFKESPVPRRLVVMFDGTSNMRNSLTNVSRFFEAIDDSRPTDYKLVDPDGSKDGNVNKVHCSTCQSEKVHGPNGPFTVHLPMKGPDGACPECHQPALKRRQLVHYVRGVGSKWYEGISSLMFGKGLSKNVKDGYKWLVNHYRVGDEIFVFGFSRGAFSARSLVSLLHRCGGLPVPTIPKEESKLTDDIVNAAYAMYQAFDPKDPSKSVYLQKGKVLYDMFKKDDGKSMQRVTVAMLGVWDTVGAVGLRSIRFLDTLYYYLSSRHYEFHDQDLPCIVEHAYHALAIDEHRFHFAPTLWTVPRLPRPDPASKSKTVDEVPASTSNLESVTNSEHIPLALLKEVKQVWFMGSHCNVGGGADLDDLFDPDDLWLYSYVWMQKHAEKLGLRFYWTFETPAKKSKRYVSHRQPESSYKNFCWGWYQYLRLPFYRDVTASINTGAAKLHWSVVKRIKVDAVKAQQKLDAAAKAQQELDAAAKAQQELDAVKAKQGLDAVKAEEGLDAVKAKQELDAVKAKLELDADEAVEKKFVPYRPESLFKLRQTPTIREWIWFKLTVLLRTLGFSKSVQDDCKLEVSPDGKIELRGEWKLWPSVEFDDLKTVKKLRDQDLEKEHAAVKKLRDQDLEKEHAAVKKLRDQDLEKEHAASKLPVAKLPVSCNCHSKLHTEFDKIDDTRWWLQERWDRWVYWWPL